MVCLTFLAYSWLLSCCVVVEQQADLSLGETTFDIPVVQDHRQGAAEQGGGSRGRRVTVTLESSNVDRELDWLNVEVDEQVRRGPAGSAGPCGPTSPSPHRAS